MSSNEEQAIVDGARLDWTVQPDRVWISPRTGNIIGADEAERDYLKMEICRLRAVKLSRERNAEYAKKLSGLWDELEALKKELGDEQA